MEIRTFRILMTGILVGIILFIAEIILEGLIFEQILGFPSEQERMAGLPVNVDQWTTLNIVLHFLLHFFLSILLVLSYIVFARAYGAGWQSVILTSALFISFWIIQLGNLYNIGLFSAALSAITLLDNMILIPFAVMCGAMIYHKKLRLTNLNFEVTGSS